MQDVDMGALATQVLWAAFALAVAFGAIAQRTHFCTMGAVADVVNIGDWSRMRMWALAIGVAILGFNTMVALGWVEAGKSIYAAPRLTWLSAALGGLVFGFGMVLASGCGSKTLVRIGGGNLKSVVVFVMLGIAAFATLKGITGVVRVATVDRVAIELAGGPEAAERLCAATLIWLHATSLGGVESSLERRRRHAGEPEDVPDNLVRLSVGIEDVEDLWADLAHALDHL